MLTRDQMKSIKQTKAQMGLTAKKICFKKVYKINKC